MARKKDYECGRYDVDAVMSRIPELLGMELTLRGGVWEGRYYINGERHPYKRDKLKVKTWAHNGRVDIFIHEQGGMSLSLTNWLQQYGGASNYAHAMCIIQRNELPAFDIRSFRQSTDSEVKYVSRDVLEEYRGYDLGNCTLFNWMCRMFGESRVREVWNAYRVCTDAKGNVVFFYSDAEGRIIHDKVIRYSMNGKRDKQFITRRFKTADGYRGRAYYGSHLVEDGKRVVLMESEKSVLLSACYFGIDSDAIFLATGGKGNVRDVDERTWLAPDIDAVETWSAIDGAQIWEWWNSFSGEYAGHDDIGDAIVRKMMGDYRGGERYV